MGTLGNRGNGEDFTFADAIRSRSGNQQYTYARDESLRGSSHQPHDGDAGYSYFVVPDRGPNGEFTTVSDIAEAILLANPGLKGRFPNVNALSNYLQRTANDGGPLYDYNGRLCDGSVSEFPLIQPGQLLIIPRIDNPVTLVATRPIEECVDQAIALPVALMLLEAPQDQANTVTEIEIIQQRVALTRQPDEGGLGTDIDGNPRVSGVQDVVNMPRSFGIPPEQPDPAARGKNRNGTGTQTVYGTGASVVGEIVQSVGPRISLGPVGIFLMPRNDTFGNQSANRRQQAREGGNVTSQQTPGETPRYDIPFLSDATRRDATFLPGVGNNRDAEGRIIADLDSPHGQNAFYFGATGNAGDVVSITMSDHELRTGEPNRFIAGRPSAPVPLYGLSNYGTAQLVFTQMNREGGEVDQLRQAIDAGTADQAQYQRYVALMRFQQDLVGMSNYDITSDIPTLVARERALAAREGVAEDDSELVDLRRDFSLLNPREQLEFAALQAEAIAGEQEPAITGLNMTVRGDDLTGADYPVRAITREAYREMMFDYYAVMATTREDAFKDVAEREVRSYEEATGQEFSWPGRRDGSTRNRPASYNADDAGEAYTTYREIREALRAQNPDISVDAARVEALRIAREGGTVGEQRFEPLSRDLYRDLEPMVLDVTAFVDNLTDAREYPEDGYSYEYMDEYFRKPEEDFNPAERFNLRPQQSVTDRDQALSGAMGILAADPELTRLVLGAADDEPNIAQAIARFDSATVQLPGDYGGGGWDRGDELAELRRRYPQEYQALFGANFSREEWNGLNREGDALERAIAASANDDAIVALRQQDFMRMVTGGDANDRGYRIGQSAEDLLYGLALEPNNATWQAIEARVRETSASAEEAEARIQTLRQGLEYAYNERNTNVRSINQDELATQIGATEILRDNGETLGDRSVAPGVINRREEVTVERTVDTAVRAQNMQLVYDRVNAQATNAQDGVLADLRNSGALESPVTLFSALEMVDAEGRAEVFAAAGIAGDPTDIWTRILAESTTTTRVTTETQLNFDGVERFTDAMQLTDPTQRVAALIEQYAQLQSSQGAMANAVAEMSSGNTPMGALLQTSVATNVALANFGNGNAAFTQPLVEQLREQGGDLRREANRMRNDMKGDMRGSIREGVNFTRAEDYVPQVGVASIDVQVSRWTYTLSVPQSDNPRVQAWIESQSEAELEAFMAEAARNAVVGDGPARGQMRDVERAVEDAIYEAALPSREALERELGEANPYHRLANILTSSPVDAAALQAFTADPANAQAMAMLTQYTLSNDFAGVQTFWQSALAQLAANPNSDPFGLGPFVSPANDMTQVNGYNQLILGQLTQAIASQDPANTAAILAQTQGFLAESPTIPGGWHIPFIPLPAFFDRTTQAEGIRIIPPVKDPGLGSNFPGLPRIETFVYDTVTRTTVLNGVAATGINLASGNAYRLGEDTEVGDLPNGPSPVPGVAPAQADRVRE